MTLLGELRQKRPFGILVTSAIYKSFHYIILYIEYTQYLKQQWFNRVCWKHWRKWKKQWIKIQKKPSWTMNVCVCACMCLCVCTRVCLCKVSALVWLYFVGNSNISFLFDLSGQADLDKKNPENKIDETGKCIFLTNF